MEPPARHRASSPRGDTDAAVSRSTAPPAEIFFNFPETVIVRRPSSGGSVLGNLNQRIVGETVVLCGHAWGGSLIWVEAQNHRHVFVTNMDI